MKLETVKPEKRFFYNELAPQFDEVMNLYDLKKRLRLVFDHFWADFDLSKNLVLDAGCGTGWFSQCALHRGANVIALDIGELLLHQAGVKGVTRLTVGDLLSLPFEDNQFDFIVCSEAIEHTVNPHRVVSELARVLKIGGNLCLTTPNRLWHPSVRFANWLKIRPYEGYENWVGWNQLKKWCGESGLQIEAMVGFHLFPFTFFWTHRVLNFFDQFTLMHKLMVNIGLQARKT